MLSISPIKLRTLFMGCVTYNKTKYMYSAISRNILFACCTSIIDVTHIRYAWKRWPFQRL